MKPFFQSLLLAGAALMSAMNLFADSRQYYVTVKDGLSNSSINSIMQDSRGLIWLSTWNGINVYNGSSLKIYKSDPSDEKSLLDNIVRTVTQEDDRYYWAVTDWGLNRLDITTGTFKRFKLGFEKSAPFSGSSVSMSISRDKRIFCSSRGWGIAVYNPESEKMIPFNIQNFNTSSVSGIVSSGSEDLILQTMDGRAALVHYIIDSEGNVQASLTRELLPASSGQYTFAEDEKNVYLIGRDHIYNYERDIRSITDSIAFSGTVSCASMSPDKGLYIVADRSKMFNIDFKDHSVKIIPESSRDNLLSFCFGTQNVLWLAIDGIGLEACYESGSALKKIDSEALCGTRGGAVTAMVQVPQGDIYASVLGGGLYVLDSNGKMKGKAKGSIPPNGDYIFSMTEGPDDCILTGVRNAVALYSPSDGRTVILKEFQANPQIVVYCLHYDERRNRVWLGTLDRGIYSIGLERTAGGWKAADSKRYFHDQNNKSSLSSDNVMHIAPCGRDSLWIGTLGGGLNILDTETGKCTSFTAGGKPDDIPSDNARFAFQDSSNSIWVGTSYGLCHGTADSEGHWSFKTYNEKDGLSDNTVHSILKDKDGRIWMGTNRGLSMFDPKTEEFTNQDNADNLQGQEFYVHSCMMAQNGEMYFGGVNGLNHFFPQQLKPREFSPLIIFEDLTIRLDNVKTITEGAPVVLTHDENFFNIGFSAIEYINNSNCEYAYKLDGFNNDWVSVPSGVPATFTNVPPGKYVFRVKSTNGDKAWCENERTLGLVIRNPWYLTVWALFTYSMIIIVIVLSFRRFREDRRRQRAMLAKEAIEKQSQKEAYEAKLNFFTNIAHEFGTPLTLISCSGEQLAANAQSQPKANRYIRIINDNAARMQKLIQELLEFRKVESGHYEPEYSRVNPVGIMNAILEDFSEMEETHDLSMTLDVKKAPSSFICDETALEKIFINLISNAHKYTPDGGTVAIVLDDDDGKGLHCSVTNTSKGLSPEKLSRVFDRFVILDNLEQQMAKGKKTRNGVGMALVQSFVTTLGGSISVDSELDKSVTFDFRIPDGPEKDAGNPNPQEVHVPLDISEETVGSEVLENESVEAKAEEEETGRPVIMIVDDDVQIRDLVEDILNDSYKVIKAADGQAALESLRKETADLIITDINMPNMDGMEMVRRLKSDEMTKFIPVVFLAFKNDVTDEVNSYNIGSEAFIPKPFVPAQLTAIVGVILKNRSSLKNYYKSAISDVEMFNGTAMSSEDRKFISSIVNIVEERMAEDISPADVAARLCVSDMTLYRKTKNMIGKSPGEFIRSIKLNHAANLLKTTSLTVQEIMFDCGFNNKSWFFRKFAETFNKSPKEYRKST